jgi:hypothetical protein
MSDSARKPDSLLVGIGRAMLPSVLTALFVGFASWKVLEYQVITLGHQVERNTREIDMLKVSVPVLQSQSSQYVQRLDASLVALQALSDKMDQRLTWIERYLLDRPKAAGR